MGPLQEKLLKGATIRRMSVSALRMSPFKALEIAGYKWNLFIINNSPLIY